MMKKTLSAAVVALLSAQQAEAQDFGVITKALSSLISGPKKAAIDSVMTFAAAPSDDEIDHVINLDEVQENANGLYQYDGKIGSDELVEFTAEENPTTGYSYMVDSQNCGARFLQTDTTFTKGQGIGAPGKRTWTFKTPSEEENYIRGLPCDVKFYYQRSWENHDNEAPKHVVRVTIGERQ